MQKSKRVLKCVVNGRVDFNLCNLNGIQIVAKGLGIGVFFQFFHPKGEPEALQMNKSNSGNILDKARVRTRSSQTDDKVHNAVVVGISGDLLQFSFAQWE